MKMDSRSFLCAIYAGRENHFREKDFIRRTILSFLGEGFPFCEPREKKIIDEHLHKHYCRICGEYIHNHFPQRESFHHHHSYYPHRYESIFMKRIKIFPKLNVLVLERLNPSVGILPKNNFHNLSVRSAKITKILLFLILSLLNYFLSFNKCTY